MPPGRPKTGKTTMQDIADRLGISKVSVSKALNGKAGISPALRHSIFSAALEMGYDFQPPEGAVRFAFVVSRHLLLETDALYSQIYYQFNQQCLEMGVSSALVIVSRGDVERNTLPSQMQAEEFSGVAVAGELPDAILRQLEKPGRPLVLMDFESSAVSACAILPDNYRWAKIVTQRLANEGHKKIGFVGLPGITKAISDRYFGYRCALLLNHLPFQESWTIVNNDAVTGLYSSNIRLPEEMPTAFVCSCDMAAYYLLMTLKQHGLQCPGDVSIISFDNTRLAEACSPPLTSVGLDQKAFAAKALELLIHPDQSPLCGSIYLPAFLAERQSTRPLPPKKK